MEDHSFRIIFEIIFPLSSSLPTQTPFPQRSRLNEHTVAIYGDIEVDRWSDFANQRKKGTKVLEECRSMRCSRSPTSSPTTTFLPIQHPANLGLSAPPSCFIPSIRLIHFLTTHHRSFRSPSPIWETRERSLLRHRLAEQHR